MKKTKLYRGLWYTAGTLGAIGMLDIFLHGVGILVYAVVRM